MINMPLGEALKRFRKAFKLSSKDTALTMGVSPQMYSTYESNKSAPSITLLVNLANAYDVSLDYLAGRVEDPNPYKKSNKIFQPENIDNEINDLTTAAENDRVLDFYENLSHVLAKQGIKI